MSRRYLDMGDRIELAKAAMEFADKYQLRPVQLYHAMVEAVTEEPGKENDE